MATYKWKNQDSEAPSDERMIEKKETTQETTTNLFNLKEKEVELEKAQLAVTDAEQAVIDANKKVVDLQTEIETIKSTLSIL